MMMRMVKVFGITLCLNLSGCGYEFVKKSENKLVKKSENKPEKKTEEVGKDKSVSTEPSIIGLWEYECEKSERSMGFGGTNEFETLYGIQTLNINDKKMKIEKIYYKDRKCNEKILVEEAELSIKISKEDQNSYLTDMEVEYASETIYDRILLSNFNTRKIGFGEEYQVQEPFEIGVPKEFNLQDVEPFYTKTVIKDGKFCMAEQKGSRDGSSENKRATEIDEDNCATRI